MKSLVHCGELGFDRNRGFAMAVIEFPLYLCWRVTLCDAVLITTCILGGYLHAILLPIELIQVRSNRICVESLHSHFMVHCCRAYLIGVSRSDGL